MEYLKVFKSDRILTVDDCDLPTFTIMKGKLK